MKQKIRSAFFLLLLLGMIVPFAYAAQDTDELFSIDGDWAMTTVFDDGAYQEQITLRAFPPIVFIRSDRGYCTPGMLISKDSSGYLMLWRFYSARFIGRYKGSLREDACSYGGPDYEPVIAGDAAYYSLFSKAQEGSFVAHKINTLEVSITPEGSGTVVSAGDAIDCGADCTERYTGGCRKVSLTAQPAAGWIFSHWETGSSTAQDNPLVDIRVNADIKITAVFAQENG